MNARFEARNEARDEAGGGAGAPRLSPIEVRDLPLLLQLEAQAYAFPWSRGNFIDSLAAGYVARKRLDAEGRWIGYFVLMPGVDEMHLLNLTVVPALWRQGHGRRLLADVVALACERAAVTLWLEVRPSNAAALALYRSSGFGEVGRRRGYYPASHGQREDAIVMSLPLPATARDDAHDGLV